MATITIFPNSPDQAAVGRDLERLGYRVDPVTGRAEPTLARAVVEEVHRLERIAREYNTTRRVVRSYIHPAGAPGRMGRVVDIRPGRGPNNVA